jgi:hypothetical protein
MNTRLDHLVVAADTLEQGVAWCEATLGVVPGPGGRHALFGTHNRLLKIATPVFEDAYLEIIAVDPQAPSPARPRWFGLDDPSLRERLRVAGPQLVHAVARSPQLDMHRWGLIQVGLQPGEPVQAGRDTPQGPLAWEILVRPDGALLCGGALPTLIQWKGRHPAQAMPDCGVTLQGLTLRGVPARAAAVLRLRGVEVLEPSGDGPALQARLATPRGEVVLCSAG